VSESIWTDDRRGGEEAYSGEKAKEEPSTVIALSNSIYSHSPGIVSLLF
jgi:hypothetical protein